MFLGLCGDIFCFDLEVLLVYEFVGSQTRTETKTDSSLDRNMGPEIVIKMGSKTDKETKINYSTITLIEKEMDPQIL